jgi:Muconolactone delta-isomerase
VATLLLTNCDTEIDSSTAALVPVIEMSRAGSYAGRILAGGAVVGKVAPRFVVDTESEAQVDAMITSLPLWPVAETRVTPLLPLSD